MQNILRKTKLTTIKIMKQFFKMFAASLLAITVAFVVPFFMFVGIISLISSFGESDKVVISANSIIKIDLSAPVVDQVSEDPMTYIDFSSMKINKPLEIQKAVQSIYSAATDSRISAIYIEPKMITAISLTNLQELRVALEKFKESGKKIYSYSSLYDNSSYYLSSVATDLTIAPLGMVFTLGLSSESVYMKDLFEKYGIDVDLIRAGKYKSAGEPFIASRMSKENREQNQSMLDSIWDGMISDISASRGVEVAELNKLVDNLSAVEAKNALDNKLVDAIRYIDEMQDVLESDYPDYKFVSLLDYSKTLLSVRSVDENKKPILSSSNKIALVNAVGSIVDGKSSDGKLGSETFIKTIQKIRKDSSVKAVVLRISSPGGSALASDYMWRELSLLQKEKPLVVSMGAYAASGGYYIAAPADFIYADRATLTGSIGVFSIVPNFNETISDFGLNVEGVSTNKSSQLISVIRKGGLTSAERAFFQSNVNTIYTRFKEVVSIGRNIPVEKVDELAQGRVWTGEQALENGLVDAIGGVSDAILMAAERAGILDDFILHTSVSSDNKFQQIMSSFSAKAQSLTEPNFGLLQPQYNFIKNFEGNVSAQTIMPYQITIK